MKPANISYGFFAVGCVPPYNEGTSDSTAVDRFLLSFFTTLITVLVVVLSMKKNQNRLLACFDVRKHFNSLFDTSTKDGEITCLHGMRVITMLVVVFFHSFMIKVVNIEPHTELYEEFAPGKFFIKIYLGFTSVDTFLVISAILSTRSVLKYLRKGTYNYPRSVIMRYFRLMLMVMFVLLVNKFLSASLKDTYDCFDAFCQRWWWRTLLLIQNIFIDAKNEQLCLLWLWYLAVDFHMFVLSPALIYLLWKYGQRIVPLAVAIVIAGVAYRYHITTSFDDDWIKKDLLEDFSLSQQLYVVQFLTSTRFTPYIFGVIFGFYIDRMEMNGSNLQNLPKPLFVALWFNSFLAVFTICVIYFTKATHYIPDEYAVSFYVHMDAFFKFWWSPAMCWVVMASRFGRGGFINNFFSCRFFQIISKLCFSMYLIHFVIQLAISHFETDFTTFGIETLGQMALEIILTIAFATFSYVFIEEPFREMSNKISSRKETAPVETAQQDMNMNDVVIESEEAKKLEQ